jgi:hypothetical protein
LAITLLSHIVIIRGLENAIWADLRIFKATRGVKRTKRRTMYISFSKAHIVAGLAAIVISITALHEAIVIRSLAYAILADRGACAIIIIESAGILIAEQSAAVIALALTGTAIQIRTITKLPKASSIRFADNTITTSTIRVGSINAMRSVQMAASKTMQVPTIKA